METAGNAKIGIFSVIDKFGDDRIQPWEKDRRMLKNTMIAGFAALALLMPYGARAAGGDNGGFDGDHFSNSASAGLQDPAGSASTASDVDATAAASIEPAAGGGDSVFATTQAGNASSGAAQPTAPAPDNNTDSMTTISVYP